jgi:hypothetical protein
VNAHKPDVREGQIRDLNRCMHCENFHKSGKASTGAQVSGLELDLFVYMAAHDKPSLVDSEVIHLGCRAEAGWFLGVLNLGNMQR